MSGTYTQIYMHLIWGTKKRRPLISQAIRQPLHTYMAGIGRKLGSTVIEINGVEDHVHLLCAPPHRMLITDFIGQIKQASSRWMSDRIAPDPFAWQVGYGAFSVSYSMLSRVQRYIQRQEEHHRTQTFDEEYQTLADRCETGS